MSHATTTDVQDQRRPARLVAQRLGQRALARAGRAEQEDALGADVATAAGPQGAGAERLEGLQAAQVGERLAAPVQRQQARLLQHAGLQLPERLGGDAAVAHEREAVGALGLEPRQSGGRVQDAAQLDDGDMWPASYAVLRWSPAVEKEVTRLVRAAVS